MSNAHFFIGIPVTEPIRKKMTKWQSELKEKVSFKNWTNPEDLHITLKFLGGADITDVKNVNERLQHTDFPAPFSLNIDSLSYFGKSERPRVVFGGVEKNDVLFKMQSQVEHIAAEAGFPKENRSYHPHITLAKKWDFNQPNVTPGWLEGYQAKMEMKVDRFHIYRIHPGKKPKYEAVATILLK
ncbi:RNA 2',3'-cyclic phosphodiesterase [Thalassobacillus pellis]|uniref:RNA 2',3'-cyclic phosphodiesterase n=1 Tax=Thalassobacillus pellis TaxID=748008 RepID=UPI0019616FE7|nr:RNA 2',3'-cyclic phosphodiesterase [Thalassobacillus pellis]MBM7554912.1 2'-5' RNA ligase [Thalassobacillus pellis]